VTVVAVNGDSGDHIGGGGDRGNSDSCDCGDIQNSMKVREVRSVGCLGLPS
jgi:hypothetical protein